MQSVASRMACSLCGVAELMRDQCQGGRELASTSEMIRMAVAGTLANLHA
ncbi:hypothetical protein SAFG77S_08270 [Streptomyces afghaniensis]